jgi:hypothetical protein
VRLFQPDDDLATCRLRHKNPRPEGQEEPRRAIRRGQVEARLGRRRMTACWCFCAPIFWSACCCHMNQNSKGMKHEVWLPNDSPDNPDRLAERGLRLLPGETPKFLSRSSQLLMHPAKCTKTEELSPSSFLGPLSPVQGLLTGGSVWNFLGGTVTLGDRSPSLLRSASLSSWGALSSSVTLSWAAAGLQRKLSSRTRDFASPIRGILAGRIRIAFYARAAAI